MEKRTNGGPIGPEEWPRENGGDLLIQMLERAGVRQFFTLHGGHLDSIFMAAQEHDFCMTDMRHEQAAVQAADG